MKALLIINTQKDFLSGEKISCLDTENAIKVINDLMKKFDIAISCRDWHPENSLHFKNNPVHCVKNSKGAEFPDDLDQNLITKELFVGDSINADNYSAFDAKNINLENYLDSNNIEEIYICGLSLNHCIKETATKAATKGYLTYLIEDAVKLSEENIKDEEEAYSNLELSGVRIKKSYMIGNSMVNQF